MSRSPFVTAVTNPLVLAMLGLAVAAGLCAAWWLFPIGVLLAAVMMFRIARDPSLLMSRTMETRATLAPKLQAQFSRIERTQVGIFNALAAAPPQVVRALEPLQADVDALIEQAHRLGARMTSLENYRTVSNVSDAPETELTQLNQQIQDANDPMVKREYEESRAAIEKRIINLRKISTILDRVQAQFVSLANELDGLLAEIIRLQAQGGEAAAKRVPDLQQTLRSQKRELIQFEQEAASL